MWSAPTAAADGDAAALTLSIVDKSQLQELFTETEAAQKKKKALLSKEKESAKSACVLDNSRARNIEILLRAVKVSPAEIVKAIGALDSDALDYESLCRLGPQWPTVDEAAAVQSKVDRAEKSAAKPTPKSLAELVVSAQGEGSGTAKKQHGTSANHGLSVAEDFVYQLTCCSAVPRLPAKLQVAIFRAEFPAKVSTLGGWITTVTTACEQVRGSTRFSTLLQVVLALGNTLNALGGAATARSSTACGFRLSSLPMLANTKSFDGNTSLLQILVRNLDEKQPEILDVADDMAEIGAAAALDVKDIFTEVNELSAKLATVREELARARGEAEKELEQLGKQSAVDAEADQHEADEEDKENQTDSMPSQPSPASGAEKQPAAGTGVAQSFCTALESFLAEATVMFEAQESAAAGMRSAFASLLAYTGEAEGCSLAEFFGSLSEFLALLAKTREAEEAKRQRETRRAAAAAAAAAAPAGRKGLRQRERQQGSRSAQAKLGNELATALGKLRGIIADDGDDGGSPHPSWSSPASSIKTPPKSASRSGGKLVGIEDDEGEAQVVVPLKLEFGPPEKEQRQRQPLRPLMGTTSVQVPEPAHGVCTPGCAPARRPVPDTV